MDARVIASPDGAHLAVLRDHRLSLFALDTGRRVAVADVTGSELAFAGSHLVVHGRDALASMITVLALPTLTVSSSHELTAPTRMMAAAHAFVLLDRGDQALLVQCGKAAAVTPLRPPAVFSHAVGLDGPQFVTFGTRGAELWDAASRRPEARLRLELPADTVDIGLTNRHALLWAATSQPCLHLARISDGRVSTLWLDATPLNVRSHPVAAWVVADVGNRALAINLAIGEVVPLDTGHSAVVAVAPRRDRDAGAVVVFLDGDALELRLLGGEARPLTRRDSDLPDALDAELETPAAAAGDQAEAGARPLTVEAAARASSLRERLGQRGPTAERTIPPATVVAPVASASSLADRIGGRSQMRSIGAALAPPPEPAAPGGEPAAGAGDALADLAAAVAVPAPTAAVAATSASPSVAASASPSAPPRSRATPPPVATPAARFAPAEPPRAAVPPAPRATMTPAASAARAPAKLRGWRDELVAWVRAGSDAPAPALEGSRLRGLHDRLELAPAAWPIACALYGRWLLGAGGHGLATARLAAIAGDGGWAEALGTGGLGGLGLLEWRHGRAALADGLGDYLDERLPATAELLGGVGRRAAPPGQTQVIGSAAAARGHAERLADDLGQVALWTGAAGGRELTRARLEAWLRGVALIVVGDPGPLTLRAEESVIAVVPLSVDV